MKTINKILLGLCAMAVLAACSDSDSYSTGSWNAAEGYAKVAFAETSIIEELDPSDPCEKVVTLTRGNTEGELTVPVTILSNTDDVFMLSPVTFADGESEADLTISFDDAQVGKEYSLELLLEGEQYVSFYSSDIKMSYTVTRVKWNPAGYYYDEETGEKVEGWAMYTDDLVNLWYGVGMPTYPVPVEERDDRPGYYRIINAYGAYYPLNEEGDYDPDEDTYIYIDATSPDSVYIPVKSMQSADWGSGNFYVWSEAAWQMEVQGKAFDEVGDFLGTYENGKITFPVGALIFGEAGYGGDNSNNHGGFCLMLDPDKNLYNADIATDFEWEDYVPEAEFTSNLYEGYKRIVSIYKGTCTATKDDCDKRFAEEYGTAYMIESPYVNGTNLYFCVNEEGNIVVPKGYEKQPTGEYALNKEVYATITTESINEEKVITLNISFTDKSGSMSYANTNEVFELWQYEAVGIASYTYTQLFAEYDAGTDTNIPVTVEDLELLEREDGGVFRVSGWGDGTDLMFYWNQETNDVTVPEQVISYHPEYGDIYVAERDYYEAEDDEELTHSTFDTETNTFQFGVAYYDEAGCWGFGIEDMEVEFYAEGAKARPKAKAAARTAKRRSSVKLANNLTHKAKPGRKAPKAKKALKGTPVTKNSLRRPRNGHPSRML